MNESSETTGGVDPRLVDRLRRITEENERIFRELVAGERRFRGLAKAVWRVQEAERRRLARELHDGIGQTLTALKTRIEFAAGRLGEGHDLHGDLTSAAEAAAQALQDTRELSRLLRPSVLDDLGLGAALSWLARTIRTSTGLDVEVVVEEGADELDPDLQTLVFRVVQESLNNAVKHSGADRASVTLRRRGRAVQLRITDEGEGFDPAVVFDPAVDSQGVGLRGIRDRAELFGGVVSIDSAPGRGVRIGIDLPAQEGEHR